MMFHLRQVSHYNIIIVKASSLPSPPPISNPESPGSLASSWSGETEEIEKI